MKLEPDMVWRALFGLFYGDILMLLLNQVRPNEVHKGEAQKKWKKWIRILAYDLREGKHLTISRMKQNFIRIAADFSKIELVKPRKQRIGIVGTMIMKERLQYLKQKNLKIQKI